MVIETKEVLKQAIFATILQALETEVRRSEEIMTITGNRMADFLHPDTKSVFQIWVYLLTSMSITTPTIDYASSKSP